MPGSSLPHPGRRRVAGATAVGLVVLSLAWMQPGSGFGRWLVRGSYDALFALRGPRVPDPAQSPVALVYLDLESHRREGQDPARPWDRALHARLLGQLTAAGARAVLFDIVFSGPGPDPAADAALADALRRNGRTVLAAELSRSSRQTGDTEGVRSRSVVLPHEPFRQAAAGWGLAYSQADEDFVARRHFDGYLADEQPSLVWAAAQQLDLPITRARNQARRWMNYYGPPLSLPHVSYADALQGQVPAEFFRDRVILVGARPQARFPDERLDELRNPYGSWGQADAFMPGVEVHATQLMNLLREDSLHRLEPAMELPVVLAAALLAGLGLVLLRPWPALGLAASLAAATVGGSLVAFRAGHLWFPWMIVVLGQLPPALLVSLATSSLDWYRQRRRLEQRIREQAALITKAQDAILVRELDGRIRFANPSAGRLYQRTEAELANPATAPYLFPPDDPQIRRAEEAVRRDGDWTGELREALPGGSERILQSRWTLIRDAGGAPDSILVINTDITEKKRLEAESFRVQRMETIGALAGGMAHDLNNALAPILMGIQRLRRQPADADTERMLSIMESNTHRGADMVRQVLLLARGREADRELLDLPALLRELERMVVHTFPRQVKIAVLAPPDLWPVTGNSTQIHQALLNLCVNARDAMPDGGEITLAADNVDLTGPEAAGIPGGKPGPHVMLVVSDTGPGLPPRVRQRLFEPFVTTKPAGRGTGLGLATVARIVRLHDGFIHVRSEPGTGTTFELYLPKATVVSTPAQPPSASPAPAQLQGETVLVADDDLAVRELVAATLAEAGCQVTTAADAAGVLDHLARATARPHCLVLDAHLPLLDSAGELERLRQAAGSCPVLLLGGGEAPGPNDTGGARESLSKPFTADELTDAVKRLLSRNSLPPS